MRNKLSNVYIAPCIALLMTPACSTRTNNAGAPGTTSGSGVTGSGGAATGTVGSVSGTTAGTAMGGGVTSSGGAATGTVGSISGTTAGTAMGGGGSSSGGAATGTVSSVSGTTAGTATGGGGSTAGGAGGTGGTMNEPVMRPPIEVEGTVPSEYGNPVANPGEWTPHTYPVYYYVTEGSGLTEDDTVEMQASPIMKQCNVYSPPDYDPEVEYPLILVLHGITDNHNTWMERGDPKPDVLLDNLITSEIIEPVIAVFAQGDAHEDWASHDDFSDDGAGYFVFGHELMNDLLPYIEANYSVKKDRNYRAFSGFSYGGRQTVNVGLSHHLQYFAWFGAFAAAGGPYGSTRIADYLEDQDVTTYPLLHFYTMAGDGDSAAGTVEAYEQELPGASPAITSENFTAQVVDGAHNYPTVTVGLYNFLRIAFGIVPE